MRTRRARRVRLLPAEPGLCGVRTLGRPADAQHLARARARDSARIRVLARVGVGMGVGVGARADAQHRATRVDAAYAVELGGLAAADDDRRVRPALHRLVPRQRLAKPQVVAAGVERVGEDADGRRAWLGVGVGFRVRGSGHNVETLTLTLNQTLSHTSVRGSRWCLIDS